ncbi:Nucleic acid-binding [Vigna unguiculata]|uniref:Nucleic acid-binding n=1 Tax=Vigna unguiculata TaxID=3917 RepID=A0A4D6LY69_VIGUN|nr:Nucleic acid-binding [Vigna unguiculata]
MVDIIGVVDNVRCNPQSKNVVFHIKDLSSAVIRCTLWDSYYFKFMSNWRGEPDSFIVVVMLTQVKIKSSSGL